MKSFYTRSFLISALIGFSLLPQARAALPSAKITCTGTAMINGRSVEIDEKEIKIEQPYEKYSPATRAIAGGEELRGLGSNDYVYIKWFANGTFVLSYDNWHWEEDMSELNNRGESAVLDRVVPASSEFTLKTDGEKVVNLLDEDARDTTAKFDIECHGKIF